MTSTQAHIYTCTQAFLVCFCCIADAVLLVSTEHSAAAMLWQAVQHCHRKFVTLRNAALQMLFFESALNILQLPCCSRPFNTATRSLWPYCSVHAPQTQINKHYSRDSLKRWFFDGVPGGFCTAFSQDCPGVFSWHSRGFSWHSWGFWGSMPMICSW